MVAPRDAADGTDYAGFDVGPLSLPSLDAQVSSDVALADFIRYSHSQVATILPNYPPRFVNLNNFLWSERWMERYGEIAFIQNVLNGMASRRPRPRLEARHDSWQDLVAN